jgi:hypothetical protein
MFFFLLLPLIGFISTTQAQYTQQNVSNIFTFDNTCSDAQKGVVLLAMKDAFSMADMIRCLPDAGVNDGPAFMDLFGPSAMTRRSSIAEKFTELVYGKWKVSMSCDTTYSDPQCTDRYLVGAIGANAAESSEYFKPRLVFCKEFWGLTPLDIQVHKSIGHVGSRQARFDLGLLSDNQGESTLAQDAS